MPCNFHLRRLSAKVMEGIRAAGGTPLEYNTIAISDGITMGTEGMKTSLVSREVIADSIELVARGHLFDAVVALSGCDKTIPGTVMALARLDVPVADDLRRLDRARPLPRPRRHDPGRVRGGRRARRRHDRRRGAVASSSTPPARAPGACGGQFTANTMATAFEVMGISPMGSAMVPAMDPRKDEVCVEAGRLVMTLLERDLRPSDDHHQGSRSRTRSRPSRRPAARPTGSCTCSPSPTRRASSSSSRTSTAISARTPLLADLKPGGRFVAADLYRAGGVRAGGASGCSRPGVLNEDEHHRHRPHDRRGGRARPRRRPASRWCGRSTIRSRPTGGLVILRGNLAPERLRRQGRRPRAHRRTAARRACSSARRTRWRPSRPARSRPATSW